MQTKATCSPADADAQTDQAIMGLLLESSRPLAAAEVEREIGNPVAATDGLNRLRAAGLVHHLDGGYVFASRAAVRADQIGP
jgi:hypothetical protein